MLKVLAMVCTTRIGPTLRVLKSAVCLAIVGAALAACSGSTGSSGAAGIAGVPASTSPTGPTSAVAAPSATNATLLKGKILEVTISGPPVVKFQLENQNGTLVQGLPAADLGFGIAQLVPGVNGSSSQWNSYIYGTVAPAACPSGVTACATTPETQAMVEAATSGTLVDNGDGTYQYTFKKDITTDPNVVFNAALTHRVAFEIRGLAQANNGSYTFQPSTGAAAGIFSREIVDTATCDTCHSSLTAHGGARVEVQYCVMCHTPGTIDPTSGNTLDMKVMIHKIHTGNSLPSIQTASGGTDTMPTLGQGYWIVGYGDSLSNFNTLVYPQDTRNCTTCHTQTHANLTEAADYMNVPTKEACGACHDTINFATGANHGSAGIVADNTQCSTCHGTTSSISALQVVTAHLIPEMVFQTRIAYNIIKATQTAPGEKPVIQFSVTDPTNNNKPWNVLTDEPFTYCANGNFGEANLNLAIAWSTTDYTNVGGGTSEAAEPITLPITCTSPAPTLNADGSFTVTSANAIPTGIKGSAGILFEGHPAHDFGDGTGAQEIPVPNSVAYAPITDAAAVPRREVTSVANCNICHQQLNGHGNNRVDSVEACAFCHNPNSTDVVARIKGGVTPGKLDPTDHLAEQTMDLKVMIHAIHAAQFRAGDGAVPYIVYHNGNAHDFGTETAFPEPVNNCLACHDAGTFYPPNPSTSTVLATTISTYVNGVGNSGPSGQKAVTAATAACSSCHTSTKEAAHMTQNGGSFTAVKDLNSLVTSTETCSFCHGPGGIADVAVVHNVVAPL